MSRRSDLSPFEVLERYPAHDGTLQGVLESRAAVQAGEVFLCDERGTLTWHAFREWAWRASGPPPTTPA